MIPKYAPKDMAPKLAYSLKGAEQESGISRHTLRKMVRNRKLNAARVGSRLLIPLSELQRITAPGATTETE